MSDTSDYFGKLSTRKRSEVSAVDVLGDETFTAFCRWNFAGILAEAIVPVKAWRGARGKARLDESPRIHASNMPDNPVTLDSSTREKRYYYY